MAQAIWIQIMDRSTRDEVRLGTGSRLFSAGDWTIGGAGSLFSNRNGV